MKSLKEEAIRVLSSLPDNAPIDEVMYRLYVIDKISRGQQAIKDGQIYSAEEILKEMETW
ncbi:MAG: hypothetical protein ACOC36_01995 [Fibrobacterota bacterium]